MQHRYRRVGAVRGGLKLIMCGRVVVMEGQDHKFAEPAERPLPGI